MIELPNALLTVSRLAARQHHTSRPAGMAAPLEFML